MKILFTVRKAIHEIERIERVFFVLIELTFLHAHLLAASRQNL